MSSLLNAENYDGDDVPTISYFLRDEVIDSKPVARKAILNSIRQTSRTVEVGADEDLPMFLLKIDVSELVLSTPPKELEEFELIRI